jgi:hypothetical protein
MVKLKLNIPALKLENISENNKPIQDLDELTFKGIENGIATIEIISGEYKFITSR